MIDRLTAASIYFGSDPGAHRTSQAEAQTIPSSEQLLRRFDALVTEPVAQEGQNQQERHAQLRRIADPNKQHGSGTRCFEPIIDQHIKYTDSDGQEIERAMFAIPVRYATADGSWYSFGFVFTEGNPEGTEFFEPYQAEQRQPILVHANPGGHTGFDGEPGGLDRFLQRFEHQDEPIEPVGSNHRSSRGFAARALGAVMRYVRPAA